MHTKEHKPWKLLWYCVFETKGKALEFEKYLKSHSGRAFAKKRLGRIIFQRVQGIFEEANTMSGRKPQLIDLIINVNDRIDLLGYLSIKPWKNELSYHLYYPLGSLHEHLYINNNKKRGRVKHITLHEEIINVDIDEEHEPYIYQKVDNFLPKEKTIKAVMIESFYLNGKSLHIVGNIEQKKSQNSQFQLIGKFEKLIDFSVIIFLIPIGFRLENCFFELFGTKVLVNLDQFCSSIGRITAFDQFDLLVCLSHYVPSVLNTEVTGAQRVINFEKPMASINQILQDLLSKKLDDQLNP